MAVKGNSSTRSTPEDNALHTHGWRPAELHYVHENTKSSFVLASLSALGMEIYGCFKSALFLCNTKQIL